MIFFIHYILLTSGLSGTSVLLGVYLQNYSDASQAEIGVLLMSFPFVSIFVKPLFCSLADRFQCHKAALTWALAIMLAGYAPFSVVPFFPQFYSQLPRASWYLLVAACHLGNGALGVAWSMGEALAVNYAQKSGVPYGRMRLMGTVSWGFYGYIIGQINEVPMLPKYVPAFLILNVSIVLEIVTLLLWNNEDFEMYDPSEALEKANQEAGQQQPAPLASNEEKFLAELNDSAPSSLGGTLRLNAKSAIAIRGIVTGDSLTRRLKGVAAERAKPDAHEPASLESASHCERRSQPKTNPQIVVFRLMLSEDFRLVKYLLIFTLCGLLMAPMNFVFISLTDVCKERDCNFSKIAGSVLISQATIETISFLVIPWVLARVRRSLAIGVGFLILGLRFLFYVFYYSYSVIPPYWVIVGECAHGLAFGIFCTIMAESALMFASQSKLYIPELRRMGLLSEPEPGKEALVQAEESKINMALRATMQAIFGGFMDGLGNGTGNLLCGVFVEAFSYIKLWQLFMLIAFSACLGQQLTELLACKYSDNYTPKAGTKAHEIRSLERQEREMSRNKLTIEVVAKPNQLGDKLDASSRRADC